MDDEIGFHSRRAIEEIDVARRTADSRAARAHLSLAGQHLDRVRALSGPGPSTRRLDKLDPCSE